MCPKIIPHKWLDTKALCYIKNVNPLITLFLEYLCWNSMIAIAVRRYFSVCVDEISMYTRCWSVGMSVYSNKKKHKHTTLALFHKYIKLSIVSMRANNNNNKKQKKNMIEMWKMAFVSCYWWECHFIVALRRKQKIRIKRPLNGACSFLCVSSIPLNVDFDLCCF